MRRWLLCVVGAALLAACGDPAVSSTEPTTPAAAAVGGPVSTAATSDRTVVPESLAFTASRVGGGTINMADFAGKPVVLWFWAPT